jgi:hypothetical protein
LLCLVGGCSGYISNQTATATQPAGQQSPPDYFISITAVIDEILDSPQEYVGKPVEITGYFQGWDLLGEVGQPPPVTRSDWVIADEGGALYVTGPPPSDLNPASLDDVGTLIHLTATVAMQPGQVYLEVHSVEVIR